MSTLKGIDCGSKISAAAAQQIKADGYDFVCRYLVPANYWTCMSEEEAKGICDAGLKILSVFESSASRVKGGAAAGKADGQTAYTLACAFGIPKTAILYFAVDYEAQDADMDTIEAYLRAAREQTGDYEVGVYGSYRVIEAMASRGACRGFWQCYAWSYGKVSDARNAYQYRNGQTVAGISVDLDEAYSDLGLWTYNESEDELAMIVDQIATACNISNDEVVKRLCVLCSLVNESIEPCEEDGVAYLKAQELINSEHDPREPVAYGNLGLITQRLMDKFTKVN